MMVLAKDFFHWSQALKFHLNLIVDLLIHDNWDFLEPYADR